MQIDEKFKAVSDQTRRKILDLLRKGTMNAGEIAEACEMTKPNISQHLKVLKGSGLIQDTKQGLHVYYSLIQKDFQLTHREVMGLLSIKEKILLEVKQIAEEKKCESVTGATNSQDEGILFIMKEAATILSFQYSFRLSSFEIVFENPSETLHIEYGDSEGITNFLNIVREIVHNYFFLLDKEVKEKNNEIKNKLRNKIYYNANSVEWFGKTDEKTFHMLQTWCIEEIEKNEFVLGEKEKNEIIRDVILEVTSYGKLHDLMKNGEVSDITVLGTKNLSIIRRGVCEIVPSPFETNDEVTLFAKRLAQLLGRRLDNATPILTGRLEDRTQITISLPVISSDVVIHIIKNNLKTLTWEDLISFDGLSKEMAEFLQAAVVSNCNIVVSGGTGVGKTTALNVLGNEIPKGERIVTIEDSHELQLHSPNVIRLETRPPNSDGSGQITTGDLLKFCRELSPDRVVLGEVYDYAAYWSLELMYGGVNFMTSIHSSSVHHALSRFKNLVMSSGIDMSDSVLLERICDSVDIIIQEERFVDGTRKIANISQVDEDGITPLYVYERNGIENEKITGSFQRTEHEISKKIERKLEMNGYDKQKFETEEIKKQKKKKEYIYQIQETLDVLENRFRDGYMLTDAIHYLSLYMSEPSASLWVNIHKDLQSGRRIKDTFQEHFKKIEIFEFQLFLFGFHLCLDNNKYFYDVCSSIKTIIEERNEFEKTISYCQMGKGERDMLLFLDYIRLASRIHGDFVQSIRSVCMFLENDVTKEMKIITSEVEAGRDIQNAMKDASERTENVALKLFIQRINVDLSFGTDWGNTVLFLEKRIKNDIKDNVMYRK